MSKRRKKMTIFIVITGTLSILAFFHIINNSTSSVKVRETSPAESIKHGNATCIELISDAIHDESVIDMLEANHIFSHRGSAGMKEHSFEVYDAAIEAGSHNIEQDLVISKDGTLYVSHDLSAYAMTGTDKLYSDMTDEEIDKLSTKAGGKVLKLGEVFDRYGRNVHYLIELKTSDSTTIDAFVEEVSRHEMENLIIVQSVEDAVLEKLEQICPNMPKLMIVKTEAALRRSMEKECVDMIGARVQFVNEKNCNEAHMRGKKFVGWTLDSEQEIRHAIEIGADAYFTNDTPLAIELERKYRPVRLKDHSTLMFASDYQAESGFGAPSDNLKAIMKAAASDGIDADRSVFCGDYTNEEGFYDYQLSPEASISEIKKTVRETSPQIASDKMLFVQGNHDRLTESISESGLHEYKNYLIYVLNTEIDFPWKQGKAGGSYDKVKASADAMKECFNGLIAEGETRPVFIAGHVPLHYTARTSSRHTTGDNLYSAIIFDVVNDAAESLDIIYLYGHNHSKGWDCYMGGASVFRTKGDSLLVPVYEEDAANSDSFEDKPLNFTYMNAGYVGYYMNCGSGDDRTKYSSADEALTCTFIDIYPNRIEIRRYDEDGLHVLGADGEGNPYKGGIDEGLIDSKYYSKRTDSPAVIERMRIASDKGKAEGESEDKAKNKDKDEGKDKEAA